MAKRKPQSPREFDYYLWTTKDGKFMARVKRTGEICELNQEQFRFLRSEEKKVIRENEAKKNGFAPLSLEAIREREGIEDSSWLVDFRQNVEQTVLCKALLDEFINTLTPAQEDVFQMCIVEGYSVRSYARSKGMVFNVAWQSIVAIKKKYEKIFS